MKMDIYDLMYGLNDVSDYLVMETEKKSSQIRERFIIKWASLAAAVCLVVAGVVYSVYMNGGFGHIMPSDTPGGDTSTADADNISDTEFETEETDYAVGTETEIVTDIVKPEKNPALCYGYVTEYAVNKDKLEEILVPIAEAENDYVDGMKFLVQIEPETYENGTVMAFVNLYLYDEDHNITMAGDYTYIIRIDLFRDEYEYVDKSDSYYKALNAYGIYSYNRDSVAYLDMVFSESDKYLLYRDLWTANLKLRDKTTGEVVTIHEWNGIDGGAARGCGIKDGGVLCADRYVFYTLVTPDYFYYIQNGHPDWAHYEQDDSVVCEITNYVYDIATGEKREFLNGYELCGVNGNRLFLRRQYDGDFHTYYYSVDLSDGLNENLRDEEKLNYIRSESSYGIGYDVGSVLSADGRYFVWYTLSNAQGTDSYCNEQIDFYAYDAVTKKEASIAFAQNEIGYVYCHSYLSPEGIYLLSCQCGEDPTDPTSMRLFIFDYTKSIPRG